MSTYVPPEHVSPPPTSTPARTAFSNLSIWYKLSAAAGLAYGSYILVIVGRVSLDPTRDLAPQSINTIVLTGLSLAAIMCFLVGVAAFLDAWRREWRAREDACLAWQKQVLEILEGTRSEITDNHAGENAIDLAQFEGLSRVVCPGIPGWCSSDVPAGLDGILDRAAAHLLDRFDEYGRQRYYEGYAHREEDDAGVTPVTPLQARNGRRFAR